MAGFPLDQNRIAYLRFLRRERKQSPRGEAETDFQRAKSELIRLRIAEKKRELIPQQEAFDQMEQQVGLFLTALGGLRTILDPGRFTQTIQRRPG